MSDINHFKDSVPKSTRIKMLGLAQLVHEQIISNCGDAVGCSSISPIQGNAVSGWIPFQDGGFMVSEYYTSDTYPSYHFTDKQTEYLEGILETCKESFAMDYPELSEDSDEYCEYERDWFDPASFEISFWVEGGNIHLDASINYKDAPYYRRQGTETLFSKDVPLPEFMKWINADIVAWLTENINTHSKKTVRR